MPLSVARIHSTVSSIRISNQHAATSGLIAETHVLRLFISANLQRLSAALQPLQQPAVLEAAQARACSNALLPMEGGVVVMGIYANQVTNAAPQSKLRRVMLSSRRFQADVRPLRSRAQPLLEVDVVIMAWLAR
jgi:hypothetical protein